MGVRTVGGASRNRWDLYLDRATEMADWRERTPQLIANKKVMY